MSDQPEDQGPEPMRAEIVGSFQEDTSGMMLSPYAAWLKCLNDTDVIRHESWDTQVEVASEILFGIGRSSGDHDESEKWKEGYEESAVRDMIERVRLAAGEKIVRLMGEDFDPTQPIRYDPAPYFAAAGSGDEFDDADESGDNISSV